MEWNIIHPEESKTSFSILGATQYFPMFPLPHSFLFACLFVCLTSHFLLLTTPNLTNTCKVVFNLICLKIQNLTGRFVNLFSLSSPPPIVCQSPFTSAVSSTYSNPSFLVTSPIRDLSNDLMIQPLFFFLPSNTVYSELLNLSIS